MEYTPRMLDAALTARSAAAAGMVLLKNVQNALPLTAEDGEALPVAVFGSGQIGLAGTWGDGSPAHSCDDYIKENPNYAPYRLR